MAAGAARRDSQLQIQVNCTQYGAQGREWRSGSPGRSCSLQDKELPRRNAERPPAARRRALAAGGAGRWGGGGERRALARGAEGSHLNSVERHQNGIDGV